MTSIASTLAEAGLVAALGLGLGLGLNAVSDDGLELGRDYFPTLAPVTPAVAESVQVEPPGESANATTGGAAPVSANAESLDDPLGAPEPIGGVDTAEEAEPSEAEPADDAPVDDPFAPAHVLERLAAHGLEAMSFEDARATFEDPMYAYGAWAFIDARQPEPYAEGHIPGAWLFDRYRPEGYLADMQTLIATCERLVVYCNGGECDDSEFAADFLRQFGAQPGQLFVFVGGMEQWKDAGLPLETGERGSLPLEGDG